MNESNYQRDMYLRNQVPIKYLSKQSFMGLSGAFSALEGRDNCQKNIDTCNVARGFRPRYSTPSLSPNEGKLITQSIPNELLDVPFRAIVEPMGKGRFLKLSESLPRSVTVRNVVDYIHGNNNLEQKFTHISRFKPKAIASISFHSQILNRYDSSHIEYDVLDYIFEENQSNGDIYNELLSMDRPIKGGVSGNTILYNNIKKLTVEALITLGHWNNLSFQQIIHEAQFLPSLLGFSNRQMDLKDEEYPETLKKLSVFCLGSISVRKNVHKKMSILHRVGICHIGDLVILEECFRPLFLNQSKRRQIISLAETRLVKRDIFKGVMQTQYQENSSAAMWQLATIMGYSDGEFRHQDEIVEARSSFDFVSGLFHGTLNDQLIETITEQTKNRMDQLVHQDQREVYLSQAASCITDDLLRRYALSILHNILMADGVIAPEEMWVYNRLHEIWKLEVPDTIPIVSNIPNLSSLNQSMVE